MHARKALNGWPPCSYWKICSKGGTDGNQDVIGDVYKTFIYVYLMFVILVIFVMIIVDTCWQHIIYPL